MNQMPEWAKRMPHDLIHDAAARHKLKPEYVYAICQKETGGLGFRTRFEEALYQDHMERLKQGRLTYFLRPENFARLTRTTVATERVSQMTSWGLMQVMGFKAREMGYAEELPKLCLPHVGLEMGCRALAKFLERYQGVYRHAILAYNAGSVRPDPKAPGKMKSWEYLDGVLALLAELGDTGTTTGEP